LIDQKPAVKAFVSNCRRPNTIDHCRIIEEESSEGSMPIFDKNGDKLFRHDFVKISCFRCLTCGIVGRVIYNNLEIIECKVENGTV